MASCDFCDENDAVAAWQCHYPAPAEVAACEACGAALKRAATQRARSWDQLSQSDEADAYGELWAAPEVGLWFAQQAPTTPLRARIRQVQTSMEVLARA